MQLSKETLQTLRNFLSINPNLMLKPGNVLTTGALDKSCFATAEIAEDIPRSAGIYDLNEFLGVVSIFSDPDITFHDTHIMIKDVGGTTRSSIKYMLADPEILVYPKKTPNIDNIIASFNISATQITQITKAAAVLKSPFLTLQGDGEKLSLIVHDKSNPNSNQFNITTEDKTDATFKSHVKISTLKMISDDYQVDISSSKVLKFTSKAKMYLFACETDSEFE